MTALSEEIRIDAIPPEVIVRVMVTFPRAADDFLGDCQRRGWSERTISTYRRTYDEFGDRLPVDYDISKITTDDIRRYLASKAYTKPRGRNSTPRKAASGTIAGLEAHLSSLFKWLVVEGKIAKDPMAPLPRTRRQKAEDLDVTTVSTDDVRRMLLAAEGWPERICMGVLVYTGCRRRAAAMLRLSDYDRARGRIRFREKGGKTIWKPVPDELDRLLEAALAAGVYVNDDDYLIPNEGPRSSWKNGERDDRIVWRLVKDVAAKAGVEAHAHSLRAAFACFYLESNGNDLLGLQALMGHSNPATTQIYLRKLDKERTMEPVRSMSWGVSINSDMPEKVLV